MPNITQQNITAKQNAGLAGVMKVCGKTYYGNYVQNKGVKPRLQKGKKCIYFIVQKNCLFKIESL